MKKLLTILFVVSMIGFISSTGCSSSNSPLALPTVLVTPTDGQVISAMMSMGPVVIEAPNDMLTWTGNADEYIIEVHDVAYPTRSHWLSSAVTGTTFDINDLYLSDAINDPQIIGDYLMNNDTTIEWQVNGSNEQTSDPQQFTISFQ